MSSAQPRSRRRRVALLVVVAALSVAGGLAYARSVSPVASLPSHGDDDVLPLLASGEQQDRFVHGKRGAYVLRVDDPAGGRLFYVGAKHSSDPEDDQVQAIIGAWDDFEPTLALLEGRLGHGSGGLECAVSQFGEPGLVYVLAQRDDVDVYSIEPDAVEQARALADATDPQAAAAMLVMRFVWANNPRPYSTATLEHALRKRAVGVLAGVFADAADFDAFWQARWSAELGDWRELDSDPILPRRGRTELEAVWAIDTELRDVHMTRVLVEQVRAGERVFAVVGRSHAVVQEPALRALLPDATVTAEFPGGIWGTW